MGRPLNVLQDWSDCERCERSRRRLGVCAPAWPGGVRLVMLSVAAPRATQAFGIAPPPVSRELEDIAAALGLGVDECIADNLVACGIGSEPAAHEVAACGHRFLKHSAGGSSPAVVILRGRAAARLAFAAGLLEAKSREEQATSEETWFWRPVGVAASARVVVHPGGRHGLQHTIRQVGKVLGRQPLAPTQHPRPREGAEEALRKALGWHTGMGRKTLNRDGWRRIAGVRLQAADIRDHLDGLYWVAPFSPMYDWKFIAVDIDRHNAGQEIEFDRTLARARSALPGGLVLQSGPSRGAHIYVRVPDGWKYKDAAMIVRAYFALAGSLRKQQRTPEGRAIVTELMEVPTQPLRLPFGRGSKLWNDDRPIDAQLDTFLSYVTGSDFRAFEKARTQVFQELNFQGAWTSAKAKKLRAWLEEEELQQVAQEALPAEDPWAGVLDELPAHLAKIATTGAPSYGSRSRWTRDLIGAVADLRPREGVERLMEAWVTGRDHVSEDIENNPARALRQTRKFIAAHYKSLGGVPARAWREADVAIATAYVTAMSSDPARLKATAQGGTLGLEDLRKTAFLILRRFYGKNRSTIAIHHTYFQRFTGTNTARRVKRFLVGSGSWLRWGRGAVQGDHSDEFILREDLWPAAPGEPQLHAFPVGARSS